MFSRRTGTLEETVGDARQTRRVWDNWMWPSFSATSLEARMGNKDKGGKNTKTVASKDLKQKRQDKKAKRAASDAKQKRTP
jgi:hypothetical protein